MRLRGRPVMLFTRTYHNMLGGHLKVFDYMRHVAASELFEPVLYLTPDSTAMPPGHVLPEELRIVREPVDAQAYFIAGLNWRVLERAQVDVRGKPIVNLVQGLRHTLPGDPRRPYLSRRALRICVSPAVETAVKATRAACGPVVAIPNGIDAAYVAGFAAEPKRACAFVAGMKNPSLAQALADEIRMRDMEVDLSCGVLPREEFLSRMARCAIAVLLPDPYEGFFLPALEAMAAGCLAVLPHCAGAASFCIDGETCLCPPAAAHELADAVFALRRDADLAHRLRNGAADAVAAHSLERERTLFTEAFEAFLAENG